LNVVFDVSLNALGSLRLRASEDSINPPAESAMFTVRHGLMAGVACVLLPMNVIELAFLSNLTRESADRSTAASCSEM